MNCPKCGSAEQSTVAEGKDYLYGVAGSFFAVECKQCGLWFQGGLDKEQDFSVLYPDDYIPHDGTDDRIRTPSHAELAYLHSHLGYTQLASGSASPATWYRWLTGVRLQPHFVPNGKLLEIGCASGARLASLRALGWGDLAGIELVPAAAAKARAQGFNVICGAVEESIDAFADQSLDVVVSEMTLEHMTNPFAVIDAIAAKLKPGGQFLFSTIVRDAPDVRLYGRYWAGFDFPRHIVYFRKRDIEEATRGAFNNLESFHQVAPIDYVRSSTWRRREGDGRAFDSLMIALGTSTLHKALHVPLAFAKMTCRVSFRCRKRA